MRNGNSKTVLPLKAVVVAVGIVCGITVAPPAFSQTADEHEAKFCEACDVLKSQKLQEAHQKLNALAAKNHAKSMTVLGLLYERGLGVEKNIDKAAEYYEKAAAKGLPEAESRLGHLILESGDKMKKKAQPAEYWLTKAANHGVSEAQATLGKMYYEGNHLGLNKSEGVRWLKQAADQGHVEAQQMLEKIPFVKEADQRFHDAGAQYQTGMNNLTKAWTGYADIVNSVNSAASYQRK